MLLDNLVSCFSDQTCCKRCWWVCCRFWDVFSSPKSLQLDGGVLRTTGNVAPSRARPRLVGKRSARSGLEVVAVEVVRGKRDKWDKRKVKVVQVEATWQMLGSVCRFDEIPSGSIHFNECFPLFFPLSTIQRQTSSQTKDLTASAPRSAKPSTLRVCDGTCFSAPCDSGGKRKR